MHIRTVLPIILFITYNAALAKASLRSYIAVLPAIWISHYVGEVISTTIHELGHAIVKKIQDGDPIDITIEHNPEAKKHLIALACTPFHGYAQYTTTSSSRIKCIGHISAGPLAGILATYAQLTALELLEQIIHKEHISVNIAAKNSLMQPFTFLKNIAMINTLDRPSLSSYIIKGITFMRCSRIIGEILYGLTPFDIPDIEGDGLNLWREIANKHTIPTIGKRPEDLIVYTATPFIIAACIAGARIILKKAVYQETILKTIKKKI